jgi:hypothetical protein
LAFGSALAASVCASLPATLSEPASVTGQAQYAGNYRRIS